MTIKENINKYSREIIMPSEVAEQYKEYCRITKMKLSEPLRVFVMESVPQLHNAENLDQIILNTKNWNLGKEECEKFHVRLPSEVVNEINTYCNFFKLKRLRCHFLYYLIEKKLQTALEGILKNEEN